MSGKTTSDDLKQFFAQHGGGDEKDWKRLSKKKNGEGQWVREFENKKTGVHIEVVEVASGQFKARRLTDDANASFAKDDGILAKEPLLESDPAKNAAADKVIAMMLAPYSDDADEEDEGEIPASLLKKAGTALANRFSFAIGGGHPDDGMQDDFYVEFSPRGHDYDQHLEHVISHLLPPNGGELMELTFDFSPYKDAVKLVSDLMKRGFIWDEEYQATMDGQTGTQHLPALKAAFGKEPSAPPAKPQGPGCAP